MTDSTISAVAPATRRGTPRASLAALGQHLQQLDLFAPIRTTVQVPQKTVRYSPQDKLYDAFITLLCGVHGLVEVNERLRADPALQRAFGRSACAEQSVIQDTLDACTPTTVRQLENALTTIYRQHSAGYRHDYAAAWQVLDVDFSGQPCGRTAQGATHGFFRTPRHHGRQVGRVLASHYGEIVTERLYEGKQQLSTVLPELVDAAATVLALDAARRARTILRVDAGGGSQADINWALAQGYQYHGKDYCGLRVQELAATVTEWVADPLVAGREVGWVPTPPDTYCRPVVRVAVRCRKKNRQWAYGVIVSSLPAAVVQELVGAERDRLLAYVYFYDDRGGGVETSFKEDKGGLGWAGRNKRRWAAQQMVLGLSRLAHNVLIWARAWLAATTPAVAGYGVKRLVRDVWQIHGVLEWDGTGRLQRVILNEASRLAQQCVRALQALVASEQVVVCLGEI